MRRTITRLVVVLAALALLATPAAAHTPDAHHEDGDDTVTFTLYAVEEDSSYITREGEVFTDMDDEDDTGPPAQGDRVVFTEGLYEDAERTELVGRNHGDCTFSEVVGEVPTEEPDDPEDLEYFRLSFTCSGVVQVFGQGTLSWSGVATFSLDDLLEEIEHGYDFDEPFITVAITGGTDELIGASGQAQVFDEEAPTEDEVWSRYEVTLL